MIRVELRRFWLWQRDRRTNGQRWRYRHRFVAEPRHAGENHHWRRQAFELTRQYSDRKSSEGFGRFLGEDFQAIRSAPLPLGVQIFQESLAEFIANAKLAAACFLALDFLVNPPPPPLEPIIVVEAEPKEETFCGVPIPRGRK
jgi:hypothetical protein